MATTGVVCYLRQSGRVLLQLKAEGRFGGGLWNAPGGKVEHGESPAGAIAREFREETGLMLQELRNHGVLTFYFGEAREPDYIVHVFTSEGFEGDVCASDEGHLEWHALDALPFEKMWPDDIYWLQHVLAGRRISGTFRLSKDLKQVVEHDLAVEPAASVTQKRGRG